MNIARGVLVVSLLASLLTPLAQAQTRPPLVGPVIPVKVREAPANSTSAATPTSVDDRLLNGILELLRDAVITDVDAKISLKKPRFPAVACA